jgi:hypothetical protein
MHRERCSIVRLQVHAPATVHFYTRGIVRRCTFTVQLTAVHMLSFPSTRVLHKTYSKQSDCVSSTPACSGYLTRAAARREAMHTVLVWGPKRALGKQTSFETSYARTAFSQDTFEMHDIVSSSPLVPWRWRYSAILYSACFHGVTLITRLANTRHGASSIDDNSNSIPIHTMKDNCH